MKTRNGFVSNSSSCSFLVFTKQKIDSEEVANSIAKEIAGVDDWIHRVTELLYKAEELPNCSVTREMELCDTCLERYDCLTDVSPLDRLTHVLFWGSTPDDEMWEWLPEYFSNYPDKTLSRDYSKDRQKAQTLMEQNEGKFIYLVRLPYEGGGTESPYDDVIHQNMFKIFAPLSIRMCEYDL